MTDPVWIHSGEREWKTNFPMRVDILTGSFILVGVFFFVQGIANQSVEMGVTGLSLIALESWLLLAPSRSVTMDEHGRATFSNRGRALVVEPGELKSILASFGDRGGGLLPVKIRAQQGTMRCWPPFGPAFRDLWTALAEANPTAEIENPHSWPVRRTW